MTNWNIIVLKSYIIFVVSKWFLLNFCPPERIQVVSLNKLSSNLCYTECGDGGCRCVKNATSVVDQLYVTSAKGDVLSCICGDFQVILFYNLFVRHDCSSVAVVLFQQVVGPELCGKKFQKSSRLSEHGHRTRFFPISVRLFFVLKMICIVHYFKKNSALIHTVLPILGPKMFQDGTSKRPKQ